MGTTHYETLGVGADATTTEIRKGYYKKALETHPDKHPTDENKDWTEKFKKVGEAYHTLTDKTARADYDESLKNPKAEAKPSAPKAETGAKKPEEKKGEEEEEEEEDKNQQQQQPQNKPVQEKDGETKSMTAFDIAMSLLRKQKSDGGDENSILPEDNAVIPANMEPPPDTADPRDMSKLCAYNAGIIIPATGVEEKETNDPSQESTSGHSMGG